MPGNDHRYRERDAQLALDAFDGRDLLTQNIADDRQFYQDNFIRPALSLREIGLGMGAGNQYTAAENARADSNRAGASVARAYARDVERSGMSGDSTRQASREKRLGLSRIISEVDAANNASRGAKEMTRMAQQAGTQMYGDLTSEANSTLSEIARAEQDREQQYQDARARGRANVTSFSTMVAGAFI